MTKKDLEKEFAAAQEKLYLALEENKRLDALFQKSRMEAQEQLNRANTYEMMVEELKAQVGQPVRKRLPETRRAVNHKFNVGGHEGYMTVGMFENGDPGEVFITMSKEGSTIGGLMDTIGTLTSMALQYGVNVKTLARKFGQQRFEPSGFTTNPELKTATSIIDYVFRWLELYFVTSRCAEKPPVAAAEEAA